MKTAIQNLYNEMISDPIFMDLPMDFIQSVTSRFVKALNEEKQQHEQTAIHITNVLMDALDHPKGDKFSGEDEFNKYWENTYKV